MEQFTAYTTNRVGEEVDIATVRLTPAKMVEEHVSYDEGGTYLQYMRVPRGVNVQELRQAVHETMGGTNCTHAYDCCGCTIRHVSIKRIAPRVMQVRTKIYYNY